MGGKIVDFKAISKLLILKYLCVLHHSQLYDIIRVMVLE